MAAFLIHAKQQTSPLLLHVNHCKLLSWETGIRIPIQHYPPRTCSSCAHFVPGLYIPIITPEL